MWTGVTRGLAGIKFSGSPSSQGFVKHNIKRRKNITTKPNRSLYVKYGWNDTLSKFLLTPKGFLLPVWCRKRRCTPLKAATTKGIRKWREKNRVRVGFPTANPPHSQITKSPPITGMAENRFVITVAPQKDICPQGRTYPRNAAAITANKIITPTIQVIVKLKDLKYKPRPTWR